MATQEVFDIGPVPAAPRFNVSVTYDELKSHPELYFQGSFYGKAEAAFFYSF